MPIVFFPRICPLPPFCARKAVLRTPRPKRAADRLPEPHARQDPGRRRSSRAAVVGGTGRRACARAAWHPNRPATPRNTWNASYTEIARFSATASDARIITTGAPV